MVSTQVVPFEFDFEGHTVRTAVRDGEVWFFLVDVCRVLGIVNVSHAASRLEDDEKSPLTNDDGAKINGLDAGAALPTVINESGLYSLILTSRKAAAKRFKKWVTGTVLPSIRKTGSFNALPNPDPIAALHDPETLRALLLDNVQQVIGLKAKNAELTPKADGFDRIATATHGAKNITDSAKALQIGPKELFTYMSQNRWIFRRAGGKYWIAYQERIVAGVAAGNREIWNGSNVIRESRNGRLQPPP